MIIVNRDHKYPLINEYTGYIRKQRNLNSISQLKTIEYTKYSRKQKNLNSISQLKDYLIPSLNQKPQPQQ